MKPAQKELLRERARNALRDLYHNATITYPREFGKHADDFDAWMQDAAQFEIEYIADNGAHSSPESMKKYYREKYRTEKTMLYAFAKWRRSVASERADCGMLTGWRVLELAAGNARTVQLMAQYPNAKRNDARWEYATDYGTLYQWGRGGRTLAPRDLISERGGFGFSIRGDYADEMQPAALVEFIRNIESFNRYVNAWCAGVPEMWREHCAEIDAQEKHERAKAIAKKARETKERNYWACRDVVTV